MARQLDRHFAERPTAALELTVHVYLRSCTWAALVATIDPKQRQPQKDQGQPAQYGFGSLGIELIGNLDPHLQWKSFRIVEETRLATGNFLARVVAAQLRLFRRPAPRLLLRPQRGSR